MSGKALPNTTIGASVALLACCAVFVYLIHNGVSRNVMMAPVIFGWLMALVAARPVVERERRTALYFAFAVVALMIFFIHETYGYTGKVRDFPLIVGYTGVALCLLDILSLTRTRLGAVITQFFGSQINPKELGGRPVRRELIAFAAMGACVLGIWLFGFLVFSPIFVTSWMLVAGKPLRSSLYGGIFSLAFVWLLFEVAFKYELHRGVVFQWLMD